MCINTYIAIVEYQLYCILGQLDIHSGVMSPPQMSPLHWAADSGHVNIVKCLVEKGANLHSKDGYGVSEWDCTTDCSNYSV